MRFTYLSIFVAGVVLVIALVCVFFVANRPQIITIDADIPENFPDSGFAHDAFENLLQRYVDDDGNVDFDRWHQNVADRELLDSYLAAVGRFSPVNAPQRFARKSDQLAYWMYGYNAYVIKSVLDHWPIESVTDVKAPHRSSYRIGIFLPTTFSLWWHAAEPVRSGK